MRGRRREPGDYCILPARPDPKEFVGSYSDARIYPLQYASMTSRLKWEELARDCCGGVFFCC